LDKTAIYHKSPRGAEAIAKRNATLTPKLRSMLILVDGRRPHAELARLAAGLGDVDWLLEQLEGEGFIEPGAPRAGPPTGPAPLGAATAPAPLQVASAPAPLRPPSAPAPLAPTGLNMPLDQAQRFAVRLLTDLLGPTGQDLCVRIEAARSAQEFRAVIRRTETMLREVVGPELAARFVNEVESQRSS
jgi:hypothetical protein